MLRKTGRLRWESPNRDGKGAWFYLRLDGPVYKMRLQMGRLDIAFMQPSRRKPYRRVW